MRPIATYARTGGRPPVDDEHLDLFADGTWRLWRTLGGTRVGAFRGRLSPDRRRRLAAALAEIDGAATRPARPRPDAAREAFGARSQTLGISAGEPVRGGWGRLVRLLRRWSEALTVQPDAALELDPGAAGGRPRLIRVGAGVLRAWPATLHVDLYVRDRDGIITDRASSGVGADGEDGGAPRGDPVVTTQGWELALPVGLAGEAPRDRVVETWAWLDIGGPDGPVRARLVARRPGAHPGA